MSSKFNKALPLFDAEVKVVLFLVAALIFFILCLGVYLYGIRTGSDIDGEQVTCIIKVIDGLRFIHCP